MLNICTLCYPSTGFSCGSLVFGSIYGWWGARVMFLAAAAWAAFNALLLGVLYSLWPALRDTKDIRAAKHEGAAEAVQQTDSLL